MENHLSHRQTVSVDSRVSISEERAGGEMTPVSVQWERRGERVIQ